MSTKGGPSSVISSRKIALIIGQNEYNTINNDYKNQLKRLHLSEKDADLMNQTLKNLGFETTLRKNLTHKQIEAEFMNLKKTSKDNDIIFFYFSGHAAQQKCKESHKADNFLFGIDAQRKKSDDGGYVTRGVPLHQKIKDCFVNYCIYLIVLDACRTYPQENYQIVEKGGFEEEELSMTLMLPELPETEEGLLYGEFDFVYACQPGKKAFEDRSRNYGHLATALNATLSKPGPWPMALTETIRKVQNASNHQQSPAMQLNIGKDLYITQKIAEKSMFSTHSQQQMNSLDFIAVPSSADPDYNRFKNLQMRQKIFEPDLSNENLDITTVDAIYNNSYNVQNSQNSYNVQNAQNSYNVQNAQNSYNIRNALNFPRDSNFLRRNSGNRDNSPASIGIEYARRGRSVEEAIEESDGLSAKDANILIEAYTEEKRKLKSLNYYSSDNNSFC